MKRLSLILSLQIATVAGLIWAHPIAAEDKDDQGAKPKVAEAEAASEPARPKPKPLSAEVERGIAYLVKTQHASGGWGQGGGWRVNTAQQQGGGRVEGENVEDPPDIGNTCIALLALLRSGESLTTGDHATVMNRAAQFLLTEVGKCDEESLYVTSVRDTQLQSKIGAYVDTFLAVLVLSELKDKLPSADQEAQRALLLAKVVDKIERHQKEDGTFDGNQGWAAVLSQGICSKSLNRAWLAGANVSDETLQRDQAANAIGVVAGSDSIAASGAEPSSAGIDIYRYAAKIGGLQELKNNGAKQSAEYSRVLESTDSSEEDKAKASKGLDFVAQNDAQTEAAFGALQSQIKDEKFVAGFGNNGGEEFLSYMNISEAMCAKGGKEWQEWDAKTTEMVTKAQNKDGSWAGHHCITGRTFCTATALLTLMADRAPIPEGPVVTDKAPKSEKDR